MARDFVTPQLPAGAKLSDVMLLIIAIVGTTIAPWQLFFQQSYVIDKRITPRFMSYEKADLWVGIVLVIAGAAAMMAFTAAAFAGKPEFGALHRRGRGRDRPRQICRARGGRDVRHRPDRRLHHRRLRGVALDGLRHRRRAVAQAFAASQGDATPRVFMRSISA